MRIDPPGSLIRSRRRDPRIVVAIIFPTGSIYLTNRQGIENVPGNVIHGVLTDISSTSQTLYPDEGRATIGSMSFTAVDLNGALTAELREQLRVFNHGIRLREVRVFTGDTNDFADFTRVETYVVDDAVELTERSYRIMCSDRNRELRTDVFEQVGTRLNATLAVDDETVTVQSTEGFEMLEHTAAFTDAPNQTVGYIRIRKTGEVIRYTGKTATTFTGCTRERFGTIAQHIDVDPATAADKRPEVEEFIYLEMPGPQLLYAILTGTVLGTSIALPPAWHLGINPAHVDDDQFLQIGSDLFDPNDHTKGLILRFTHLEKVDGKRFCEQQIHMPMGTFGPIDTLGRLGLRRLVSLVSTAAPVAILDHSNIISHDPIRHVQRKVINEQVYDWNYDGDSYTRVDIFLNRQSIIEHGRTKPKELDFAGLYVSRHSRQVLQRIADTFTDRYGAPPIEFSARLSRSMNHLEIGDPVRVILPRVRDYTGTGTLDRTFEVQARRMNWRTGELTVQLFGSTARSLPHDGDGGETPPIADAWYTSEGTALSSVLTISNGRVTQNGTITGAADSRDAVYYYDGDLTIESGVTVTIEDNVQLRIRGQLTIIGTIDGAGRGMDPLSDPNTIGQRREPYPPPRTTAYFGATMPSDGVLFRANLGWYTITGPRQNGRNPAAPRLALELDNSGTLTGLPADLRGAPGGYGTPALEESSPGSGQIVRGLGGAGGKSGAGLVIVCRGLEFGASGRIDLSGGDGSPPASQVTVGSVSVYPGAGAGGAPGTLYVILDGDDIPYPDLTAAFIASQGETPQTGTPLADDRVTSPPDAGSTGRGPGLSTADHWEAAHFIQYVPSFVEPGESDDELVPPPLGFSVEADTVGALLSWTPPPEGRYSYVEIWESIDDQLENATLLSYEKGSTYFRTAEDEITRHFWIRAALARPGGITARSTFAGPVEATFGGGQIGPPGEDAVNVSITADASLQFVQAPNGGSWSHDEVDVTWTFQKGGETISAHVIRFTRSGSSISAETIFELGEATTANIVGNGTETVTAIVTHDASARAEPQVVTAISGGAKGDPGEDGLLQQYVFVRSAARPTTPEGNGVPEGWFDVPPEPDGNPLWMSMSTQQINGTVVGEWSEPTHLDGARWLSGSGAPDGSLGVIGDRYLDENNGNTYEKTGTSTWTLRNSLSTVTGFVLPSGPTHWVRDTDQTTWTPSATTVDLDCYFRKGGEDVARIAWRITRSSEGILTGASTTHVDGNLNTSRVTVTELNESTRAMSVRFDYENGNDVASVTQTVTTALSGATGPKGDPGDPGSDGSSGQTVARVRIYRRSSTTPALPSNPATFTFATGAITGLNNSWSATVPSGTDPLWISEATAAGTGTTDTIAANEWATPVVLVQNGADGDDGINSATVFLFQRNSTGAPPAVPSANLTYTFATGVLSGTLGGWSQTVPADTTGRYLWVTTATALSTTSTDTISSGEWATVRLLAKDGQDAVGANLFPDPLNLTANTDGLHGWSIEGGVDVAVTTAGTSVGVAEQSITIQGAQADTGGVLSPHFPVEAGMFYRVGAWCGAVDSQGQTTNCTTTLIIRWYSDNAGETLISSDTVGSTTGTHSNATTPRIDNLIAAPATARRARLFQQRTGNPAADGSRSNGFFVLRAVDPKLIIDGAILAQHLAALLVYAGEIVIDADGNIRSGATTYDGDGGWYIGRYDGEPALSMRAGDDFIRMRPSTGLETSLEEHGSFTGTLTGFISNPSETFQWSRTGDKVTITLEAIGGVSGNSNSTVMSLTGLPTAIRPATDQFVFCAGIINNSVQNLIGICQVSSSGSVTISPLADSNLVGQVGRAFFENTGTKGLNRYWSITYSLD